MFFAPSKWRQRYMIWNMGVSKTSDHIKIKIRMQNSSQEPPASSKAPYQDLEDMDVLYTFYIKIESQNQEQGCIKDQVPHPKQGQGAKTQSGTSSIFQSPKTGLLGHGCQFGSSNSRQRAKIQNMVVLKTYDHLQIKIKMENPSQEPSVPSRAPNEDLNDMDVLHLQNHDREPKFVSWVYERPVTISKSRSRCQTPVRNIHHPKKPHIRT